MKNVPSYFQIITSRDLLLQQCTEIYDVWRKENVFTRYTTDLISKRHSTPTYNSNVLTNHIVFWFIANELLHAEYPVIYITAQPPTQSPLTPIQTILWPANARVFSPPRERALGTRLIVAIKTFSSLTISISLFVSWFTVETLKSPMHQ